MKYEAVRGPRFVVDQDSEGEVIRIRARRPAFVLFFLLVWMAGWTLAGVAAIAQFLMTFEPFIGFWLCGWLIGWCLAGLTTAWMLAGAETLRIVHGDLELGYRIGPWARRKLYQGSQITRLHAATQSPLIANFGFSVPFGPFAGQFGSIQFSYGARSVRAASGLDEAEGQLIVERILKRLPTAANVA